MTSVVYISRSSFISAVSWIGDVGFYNTTRRTRVSSPTDIREWVAVNIYSYDEKVFTNSSNFFSTIWNRKIQRQICLLNCFDFEYSNFGFFWKDSKLFINKWGRERAKKLQELTSLSFRNILSLFSQGENYKTVIVHSTTNSNNCWCHVPNNSNIISCFSKLLYTQHNLKQCYLLLSSWLREVR